MLLRLSDALAPHEQEMPFLQDLQAPHFLRPKLCTATALDFFAEVSLYKGA